MTLCQQFIETICQPVPVNAVLLDHISSPVIYSYLCSIVKMHPSNVLFVAAVLMPRCFGLLGVGYRQSVAVSGRLLCNGVPAPGVKVKLYEKEILLDRLMGQGWTDAYGYFYLWGSKREITNIDPKVNIYHKCNYFGYCYKKFGITIPNNYITQGPSPAAMFNVGTLELAGRFSGESIDCIN